MASHNDLTSASHHFNRVLAESDADSTYAHRLDRDLHALGLPSVGAAAISRPGVTSVELALLAEYVLGIVQRAGLSDAFRVCLVADAVRRVDRPALLALGAEAVNNNGEAVTLDTRSHHGGVADHALSDSRMRWTIHGQPIAHLTDPEATARELARRTVAHAAADLDTPTTEPTR